MLTWVYRGRLCSQRGKRTTSPFSFLFIRHSSPLQYIPQMIQWNREGKFPLDGIIKYYKAEDWEQALADMKSGVTTKPVLTF
jgi:hypothetical protein